MVWKQTNASSPSHQILNSIMCLDSLSSFWFLPKTFRYSAECWNRARTWSGARPPPFEDRLRKASFTHIRVVVFFVSVRAPPFYIPFSLTPPPPRFPKIFVSKFWSTKKKRFQAQNLLTTHSVFFSTISPPPLHKPPSGLKVLVVHLTTSTFSLAVCPIVPSLSFQLPCPPPWTAWAQMSQLPARAARELGTCPSGMATLVALAANHIGTHRSFFPFSGLLNFGSPITGGESLLSASGLTTQWGGWGGVCFAVYAGVVRDRFFRILN